MRRIQIGHEVRVLEETGDGVALEGLARLRPGQLVDLVLSTPAGEPESIRRAFVVSWAVSRLGKEGPTFSGRCRWQ